MADTPTKEELVELSEEIVDISEYLDQAEENRDDKTYTRHHNRLRQIGDILVDAVERLEGDDLAYARFMLGSVCNMLGFWKQAEEAYTKALEHWPDHVGLLNELFEAQMEQRKYESARKTIEKSIEHGGETPVILQNYAAVLIHLKEVNKAKITMINCVAKFPEDADSRELLNQLEQPEAYLDEPSN